MTFDVDEIYAGQSSFYKGMLSWISSLIKMQNSVT
jgi:hypothetical protein